MSEAQALGSAALPAVAPVAAPAEPVAPEAAPATVPAFALPLEELAAIAGEAGLQWVNSDADKVRQAQQAIADAPKPVHVPRMPKPVPVLDEGPLVLVETRKDLAQVRLPFETGDGAEGVPVAASVAASER